MAVLVSVAHSLSLPSHLPVAGPADIEGFPTGHWAAPGTTTTRSSPRSDQLDSTDDGALALARLGAADHAISDVVTISPGRPVIPDPEALALHLGTPPIPSIVSWSHPAGAEPTSDRSADGGDDEGRRLFSAVLALLPVVATALGAILPNIKETVGGWSAAPRAAYGVTAVLTVALMAAGVMAAAAGGRSRAVLSLSALCARLGAILSSALLVVSVSCKLGPWGCAAGVPSAAAVAGVSAAVWKLGHDHGRRRRGRILPLTRRSGL